MSQFVPDTSPTDSFKTWRENTNEMAAQVVKNNPTAIVAPAVTDDSSLGYGAGSSWVDTVLDIVYVCSDSTVGAANWLAFNKASGIIYVETGYNLGATVQLALDTLGSQQLSDDIQDALAAAITATALNRFATIADITGQIDGITADIVEYDNNHGLGNNVELALDALGLVRLTTDQYAAAVNAAAPSGANPFATIADIHDIPEHNDLVGLQGGAADDQYHLTLVERDKLVNVEDNATQDQTDAEIMAAVQNEDGHGSGLDADTCDGQHLGTAADVVFNQVKSGVHRVGDDAVISSFLLANTLRVSGIIDPTSGFITFGTTSNTQLGRTGSGALTWGGDKLWTQANDGIGSGLDADYLNGWIPSDIAGNNTIVRRGATGHIYGNYFNMTANSVSSGISKMVVQTGDNFLRYATAAAVSAFIGLSGYLPVGGKAVDSELLDGKDSTVFELIPVWLPKTSNYTASNGDDVMVDSTGGGFTITLPSGTTIGRTIKIVDQGGNVTSNNVIIARNGNKIMNLSENLVMDIDYASLNLTFTGTTKGWMLV